MFLLIIFALINLCYAYNLNNPKPDYKNYKTPSWVYKNVYNHNKKYNKDCRKLSKKGLWFHWLYCNSNIFYYNKYISV